MSKGKTPIIPKGVGPGSVSLSSSILTEGKRQVNQTVGIRTNGNISRTFPQKSLLLYARGSYGKSRIKYPF